MKFQGEDCVLNMASYFDRNDVLLNGTFWVPRPAGESTGYRQPWLHFTHTLPATENNTLRSWLRALAAGQSVAPLPLSGPVRQLSCLESAEATEISLLLHYEQSTEPMWWAWDITSPLLIRLDIPRNEFIHLITVFDQVEWSFY